MQLQQEYKVNLRKCKKYPFKYLEVKESMNVDIKTKNIMLKGCVIIVIIVLGELRNPGFVVMRNYMLVIIKLI